MDRWQNIFMIIFLIVTGLSLCAAGLPRWANIIGGVCGIIVALFMLFGYF